MLKVLAVHYLLRKIYTSKACDTILFNAAAGVEGTIAFQCGFR